MTPVRYPARRRPGVTHVAAMSMAAALLVAGCDVAGMAFVRDQRVRIVEPRERSTVTLPVTLRWVVRGFTVTGRDGRSTSDAGYFAVFVDRMPIPPGTTLDWYALQDESCEGEPCGSVAKLSDIYATEATTLELPQLRATRETAGRELHTVRIVLLDGTGARIGESAFRVQFNFERKA